MANINHTHGFDFYADDIEGVYPNAFILSANKTEVGITIHTEDIDTNLSIEDIKDLILELQKLVYE